MNRQIIEAIETEQVRACFPVMHELRPHYDEAAFVAKVASQFPQGYRMVFTLWDGRIRGVAGFRILENLAWGRYLHVDDLVTHAEDQGVGHGSALLDWLIAEAKRLDCAQMHLDSGVQRFAAHRFYLHKGMDITCHHFGLVL